MIYLDTSVVLSRLFFEQTSPQDSFWEQEFISSRMLQFEVFNRIHARPADAGRREIARALIDRVVLLDLSQTILQRALQPFPQPVRTLDGLHLATMVFLRDQSQRLEIATYDRQLARAAESLGFALADVTA